MIHPSTRCRGGASSRVLLTTVDHPPLRVSVLTAGGCLPPQLPDNNRSTTHSLAHWPTIMDVGQAQLYAPLVSTAGREPGIQKDFTEIS